ncbi:MAG: TadE/TadG family type IV pilus assembly protein [Sphingomonadaceae bacterium]|nr:TadE/TadG family type IV pilus assembly protein [Sphingomonadaceae bacterium]
MTSFLARLRRSIAGSVVVETAIVAPVLVLLALGTFDISRMVGRQSDLQTGATEVQSIVLAVANGTATDVNTIQSVLMSTLSLPSNKVAVVKMFRCGTNSTLVAASSSCNSNAVISTYVQVTLTDTYTPMWTNFGVGRPMNYRVQRTVQIS